MQKRLSVAFAGQPNCGKSTIFNMISGIHQHIANYPGVTVDKKSGSFDYNGTNIEITDLPGTYSFSSYSLEERVAKEFIINENPDIILNVVDASNLKRNLYLTFQLLEIGKPTIVVLNMCDVAAGRGIIIDEKLISKMLNCPVIKASGAKGIGKTEILDAIISIKDYKEFKIDYEELETYIQQIQSNITLQNPNPRWLAIKALEEDKFVIDFLSKEDKNIQLISDNLRKEFSTKFNREITSFLAATRYTNAELIFSKCIVETKKNEANLTDKIDRFILNKYLSFPILLAIIFTIYELSIVDGYKITDYTWPYLATVKNFLIDLAPKADITQVPMITDLTIWVVNSAISLLNYIPIFLILFALIAILEDIGYMPRMAFILDRIFRKFGLHGQSTLPLVLGGAFVGGCAVPGIMSTKGIADEKARMATIMTVPLMNCLAKVPFYTLLVGAFFKAQMSLMLFYISTITIFAALIIAKFLTLTILKNKETAPFVMELPPYHLPTFKGVLIRAFERVWQYIKKVCTVVIAVAVILFCLLQFPGLNKEKEQYYKSQEEKILSDFDKKVKNGKYYDLLNDRQKVSALLNSYDSYKAKKMAGSKNVDKSFSASNPQTFIFINPQKGDKEAKAVNQAIRKLANDRNTILRKEKNDKITNSFLGMVGRALEPISKYAGFDWRINVAFLSSFAARESAVATLGSIYEQKQSGDENIRPEDAMAKNSGYTPLHAASIIIFMLLTPPCIATIIMIKVQTNSYLWMGFGLMFPFFLALLVSSTFFTIASYFNLSGVNAMSIYYALLGFIIIVLSFIPERRRNWVGGLSRI